MVKRSLFKYNAVLLSLVLATASLTGCGSAKVVSTQVVSNENPQIGNTENVINSAITNELAVSKTSTLATNTSQETVYVFADETGKQDHVTVSKKVTDEAGNEKVSQTESSKQAPVSVKVTYKLDGKEISASELAGKSGKVSIRFDYTNNEKKEITVNGRKHNAYVPFTMVTGTMLQADKFSNVVVTNGKLTKVGDDIVALGITMPGLADSVNLKFDDKKLDLDIPEYFEITADVKDFSLDMTLSVATTNFLTDMNLEDITIDDLKKQINELTTGANQLEDGTVELQKGTQKLFDSVPTLTDGISKLNTGAKALKKGINDYTDGASQVANGANSLSDGAGQVADGAAALADGVGQVADGANKLNAGAKDLSTGVDTLNSGAGELNAGAEQINSGAKDLSAGADKVKDGNAQVSDGMDQLYDSLKAAGLDTNIAALATGATTLYNGLNANLVGTLTTNMATYEELYNNTYNTAYQQVLMANASAYVAANSGIFGGATFAQLPEANKAQVLSGVEATLTASGITKTPDIKTAIASDNNQATAMAGALMKVYAAAPSDTALTTFTTEIVTINQALAAYKTMYVSYSSINESGLLTGAKQISDGLAALNSSVGSFGEFKKGTLCSSLYELKVGANQLKSGTNDLAQGAKTLAAGTDSLKSGAKAIADGTAQLKTGTSTLSSGTKDLVAGTTTLKSGAETLSAGAAELKTGADTMATGANTLVANNSDLNEGANALADGTDTLEKGSGELADGVKQLNEGAITLKDGMATFNKEGISKIAKLVGDDADTAIGTIKAVAKLGKDYTTFTGETSGKTSSVTFVYKTAGIGK